MKPHARGTSWLRRAGRTGRAGRVAWMACASIAGAAASLASACSSASTNAAPPPADAGLDVATADVASADVADAAPSNDSNAPDAGGFVEAPHSPLPQVPDLGGPILAAPRIVTIAYSGDGNSAGESSFADFVVTSSWLTAVGHDYGVGAGVHIEHVVLPGPAPGQASDLQTQAMLEANISNGTLPGGAGDGGTGDGGSSDGGGVGDGGASSDGGGVPDAGAPSEGGTTGDGGAEDYLYVVFYPVGTTTGSFLGGPDTCTQTGPTSFIGGYHWETQSGPYHVPYAVVPTCSSGNVVEGLADLETSASHEIIEAATDPFPYTTTAYALTDPSNPWTYTDGEVADLCEGFVTEESGFSLQRIWSNSAALAGTEPCVPAPAGAFFDVSPSPSTAQTVAAGATVTYTLTGFSTAPVAPWTLQTLVGYATFIPIVSLSTTTMNNGQTATLTIGVPTTAASQSFASVFVSSVGAGGDFNYWPVAVNVQ